MKKASPTATRKIANRTCIACGSSDAKQELVRFVKGKDGVVFCDESGRVAGRGAYLCAKEECFNTAQKRGRLAWALKCQLADEDTMRLEETFKDACSKREQRA